MNDQSPMPITDRIEEPLEFVLSDVPRTWIGCLPSGQVYLWFSSMGDAEPMSISLETFESMGELLRMVLDDEDETPAGQERRANTGASRCYLHQGRACFVFGALVEVEIEAKAETCMSIPNKDIEPLRQAIGHVAGVMSESPAWRQRLGREVPHLEERHRHWLGNLGFPPMLIDRAIRASVEHFGSAPQEEAAPAEDLSSGVDAVEEYVVERIGDLARKVEDLEGQVVRAQRLLGETREAAEALEVRMEYAERRTKALEETNSKNETAGLPHRMDEAYRRIGSLADEDHKQRIRIDTVLKQAENTMADVERWQKWASRVLNGLATEIDRGGGS